MFTASEQFITQMKLRELRTQRDSALVAYERLAREAAEAADDATRLRVLYEGLRRLRFAKQPLHPDVANLELLLREIATGRASSEAILFWRTRLERELEQGQLRAEIVYLFGALLEDWASKGGSKRQPSPEQGTAYPELLRSAFRSGAPADAHTHALLTGLFAAAHWDTEEMRSQMRAAIDEDVCGSVLAEELQPLLERIGRDPYRSPAMRSQAQRFLHNDLLKRELADALTILLDNLQEWSWPADGVPVQALLSHTKWRLFLDEELHTACLLALLGERWQRVFLQVLGEQHAHRLKRLQRLMELSAPDIVLQNERRMLANSMRSNPTPGRDIWAAGDEVGPAPDPDAPLEEQFRYWGEPGSIFAKRAELQAALRAFDRFDGYNGEQQGSALDTALTLVHAEIQLGRAAFPQRPIYVVKADLKDFYPSLSHGLLLDLLARFGLIDRDLAFFRRYLETPLRGEGELQIARSGVPHHRALSDLLGELILRLLDQHIQRSAQVLVVRQLDDIGLIATSAEEAVKAWQAVQDFCQACGLTLNAEKCGAVCIDGGVVPSGLPTGSPTWLLLALGADAEWSINAEALEIYLAQVRDQLARAPSIVAWVELYNGTVAYLEHALALHAPLGQAHRRVVGEALSYCQSTLFGEGSDAAEALRRLIAERFGGSGPAYPLPEAWLCWPITAGGPGLLQPAMLAAAYAESYAKRKPLDIPVERNADWQRRTNDWSRFYAALLPEIQPAAPEPNQVMETLVNDFIRRGSQLSGGEQQGLSPYWRWVLYIYGPQILERFGTFRFLFTALVPVQLITQRDLADAEATSV